MTDQPRCTWAGTDPLYIRYHDEEWGRPVHDDTKLFEMLLLEGAQAGLSWSTVLRKRENYRRAYDGFDPRRIAGYNARKIAGLMRDAGIIRNRLKIEAAVGNARAVLALYEAGDTLDRLLWSFVGGEPMVNRPRTMGDIRAHTAESDAMSKELRRRGFRFVGSTICYALMQTCGLVNDHMAECFLAPPHVLRRRAVAARRELAPLSVAPTGLDAKGKRQPSNP